MARSRPWARDELAPWSSARRVVEWNTVRAFASFGILLTLVTGCGLDESGLSGPDGSADVTLADATPSDATSTDALVEATTDAPTDVGGDATDAGTDGALDSGMLYGCDGGVVSDCSLCAGATMPCVYCARDGGATLVAHCIPRVNGTHCSDTSPSGYDTCPCNNDPQQCPMSFEVCHNGSECRTCGENNTDGEDCKTGGACSENSGSCQ